MPDNIAGCWGTYSTVELHGSLLENLRAAVQSSKRLQGRPVYPETMQFWNELLEVARYRRTETFSVDRAAVATLADQLELEVRRHRDREI